MPVRLLLFCLLLLAGFQPVAQQYNYVHYDVKDGLAGSTVYDICQDKDGFLWFATENGLSRFDGTHFRNFTVKDGLPDNEVLKLLPDKKGRLWIGTFSKNTCYYYKGKIYNKYNDSLVRKIPLVKVITTMAVSQKGTVAITDGESLTFIKPDNQVINMLSRDIYGKAANGGASSFFGKLFFGSIQDARLFLFNEESGKMEFVNERNFRTHIPDIMIKGFPIEQDTNFNPTHWVTLNKGMISHEWEEYSYNTSFINTTDGTWEVDTLKHKLGEHFLPGKKTSRTFYDSEGQLWFCTMGEGVYKIVSREILTLAEEENSAEYNREIFSLAAYKNAILAGRAFSKLLLLDKNMGILKKLNYESLIIHSAVPDNSNRAYAIRILSDGSAIVGFDGFLIKIKEDQLTYKIIFPIKSIDEVDATTILVATRYGAYLLSSNDLSVKDTVWAQRSTSVLSTPDKYFIGTLDGLYEIGKNKSVTWLGSRHPVLSRRIAAMAMDNHAVLWVATSDAGLVGYAGGKILRTITDANGLSSNICKSLFLQGDILWVGTNKGLNKITIGDTTSPIRHYSVTDGLPSDIINAVYAEDSLVWVGSPSGLTRFNENRIAATSLCKLLLLQVSVSGQERSADSSLTLSYRDNNISFSYAAIALKSGGEVIYHYRLKGLNNQWQETAEPSLYYQSLPGGNYELELYAVNKYGVKSEVRRFSFRIKTPFWAAWWFYALIIAGIIALTGWLVNRRNRKRRMQLEEKNRVQQQFAALEQQALQAQMNPHFIFNCLNSIQQYILTNNKTKANEYLTGFASLIRQTLDNSGKRSITVAEEIRYLSTYLEMEKMRFGDNFSYALQVDDRINTNFVEMPALLLQPYVENAIRHGIRHRESGKGEVEISFTLEDASLVCRILDNGVGRQKAIELKSRQHIEYQSKGMSLTGKRIELLNKIDNSNITVVINDLFYPDNTPAGTEVILKIPV